MAKSSSKTFSKKRSFKKAKTSVKSLSRKINKVAKQNALQYHVSDDVSNDGTVAGGLTITVVNSPLYKFAMLPYASTATTPCKLFQGTDEGEFLGNSLHCVSVSVKGTWFQPSSLTAADQTNQCRMIFFWDKSAANGTTWRFPNSPVDQNIVAAFIAGSNPNAPSTGLVNSFYNPVSVGKDKRIQILKDVRVALTAQGSNAIRQFAYKFKINKKVTFSNATGTGSFPNQWFGLCVMSDSSANPSPQFNVNIRMCYHM